MKKFLPILLSITIVLVFSLTGFTSIFAQDKKDTDFLTKSTLLPKVESIPTQTPTYTPEPFPVNYYITAQDFAIEDGNVKGRFYVYSELAPGFYADGYGAMPYTISGTAVNGVDYELIPGYVNVLVGYNIGGGDDRYPYDYIDIVPRPNGIADGDKTVTITLGYGGASATVYIMDGGTSVTPAPTVTPTPSPTVTPTITPTPVLGVKLNKTTLTLKKGKTYKLLATISPANASNKKVTWRTGSYRIATVSSKGIVKANRKGSVNIYVYTVDGKKIAKCRVTVK